MDEGNGRVGGEDDKQQPVRYAEGADCEALANSELQVAESDSTGYEKSCAGTAMIVERMNDQSTE
jgi:hypothetical protein